MTNELFIDIWKYKDDNYPFQFFIGGRGTGKTYSALKGITGEQGIGQKPVYMRRTVQELELLLDTDKGEGLNPFKPINENENRNIGLKAVRRNLAGIYERETGEDGKFEYLGAPIGYGLALSSIASMRSIDLSETNDVIYDEFIPEKHVKRMRGESDALANAYETINRNRELLGKPPVRFWLLANSNDIYNPIFVGWGLVAVCEKMLRSGKSDYYIKDRGIAIHILPDGTEFTKRKEQTALYRMMRGTQFEESALHNNFSYNDFSLIGYKNLTGYRPVCAIDNCYIYRKKGSGEYYCSYAQAKCPHFDTKTEQDKRLFMSLYGVNLMPRFIQGNIGFESYELKAKVLDLIL